MTDFDRYAIYVSGQFKRKTRLKLTASFPKHLNLKNVHVIPKIDKLR